MVLDTNKLNSYHFGRHVFYYFPWYTYNNRDISSLPILNRQVFSAFTSAFPEKDEIRHVWINDLNDQCFYNSIDPKFLSVSNLFIKGNKASYMQTKETIIDWEDIEKIRLRCILGTKKEALKHLKVIDLYIHKLVRIIVMFT